MVMRRLAVVCAALVVVGCGGGAGGFAPPPSSSPSPSPVIIVRLLVKDLLYDSPRGLLIASVPGSAAADANSVALIEPVNLVVTKVIPVGSDPNKLALSADGSTLYVGLDGAAAIRVVDMLTQTAGMQFGLGNDPQSGGPYFPEDIAVQPGTRNTIAVSRRRSNISPRDGGVAIFDSGMMRSTTTSTTTQTNVIEFSTSPATLYGYNRETTEEGFRTMAVDSGGVRITNTANGLIFGNADIKFHPGNGRIYATSGQVIDPIQGRPVGRVDARFGALELDPSNNRLFFVTREGVTITIRAYDATLLTQVASLTLEAASFGQPISLVRWGARGLAFNTADGHIFVVNPAPGL